METRPTITKVLWTLVCTLILITTAAADRPVKQNRDFNPAARPDAYSFVTTGFAVKIKSANIATDGTITARLTITDSKGVGLDVTGVQTPGTVSLSFIAAYIPNDKSQYVAYTTTVDKAVINNNPSQIQAGSDTGGKFTLVDSATGTYDYIFGTKAPATFDATATHSIGTFGSRNLSAYGFSSPFTSDDVFTFVPNGSPVVNVRDIVSESACNQCHNVLGTHGGTRHKTALCVMCHQPQSVNPDTLNTVDFKVFIHKLHRGSSLPSVKAGNKYFIFHRGAVTDFSDVVFPQDIRNCTKCHQGATKQVDNWKNNPSRAACGSCHEDVNFATGENHVNLPQMDDNQCKNCHVSQATYDFDASIPGAHVVPNNSTSLPGVSLQILKVDNATPGNAPVVTFKVSDKAGNPLDISKLASIRVIIGGPNTDYNTGPGAVRVSEDPSKTQGTDGIYTYQMTTKIPAASTGSYTVSLEARKNFTLMEGTKKETVASDNAMPVRTYFSIDNSKMVPRRQVVATEKCAACHQKLDFIHGGVRQNAMECPICHNPALFDGTSKQSVNMAVQIHSIHRGENLANPYVLGTTNFQEVRFPGDLRDCSTCHLDGTYRPENVGAQAMVQSPGGFMPQTAPISAACQGCHDDKATASHALANTTVLGESCATCHGQNADFAVDKVHARQ
jgi:OmcA/MtrC family decaheme c-type cytochrome